MWEFVFYKPMMRSYHTILYLLAILILASCKEKEVKIIKPYEGPMAIAKNVTTLFYDSAVVKIKLTAPVQQELANGNREFLDGFTLLFLKPSGEVETKMTADYGIYYQQEGLYKARGNVVIQNLDSKEQLDSEELVWKPEEERIYTDKFVRVRTKEEILMGNGLVANQDFSEYKILKPTGIFSIEE